MRRPASGLRPTPEGPIKFDGDPKGASVLFVAGLAGMPAARSCARAGYEDGSYLRNAGIPTYVDSGLAGDIGDIRIDGKDERILVKSFHEGEEYLYRPVKLLSGGAATAATR